jgi:hypothetical protein
MPQFKILFFFLILSSMIVFSIGFGEVGIISVFSQNDKDEDQTQNSKNSNNNDDKGGLTTIKVKMNKNNLDIENHDRLKIVGYLNGEGQIKYIDLKELNKEEKQEKSPTLTTTNSKNIKPLIIDLKFNKSNDISSVMVDDEYYICAYVLDNDSNNKREISYDSDSLTNDANDYFPIYDCDEGNIGLSTSKDTVTLFSTMKKYSESKTKYSTSKTFYATAEQKTKEANIDNDSEKVKITINVPISDAKDIEDMKVVSMVKGEYKIKTIDVQKALKNGNIKDGKIPVPFTFERQTEVGPIQPGDLFFGCVTSDEFSDQNSDCEKRMLKDLSMLNWVCARKDSSC